MELKLHFALLQFNQSHLGRIKYDVLNDGR